MRERGYIEGQNIAFEFRYADGKLDRFPELAIELVRLKVDIIVAAGGGVLTGRPRARPSASHRHGVSGVDPVEAGLIESLARPGGNVTGMTNLQGDLGKRLELLKKRFPNSRASRSPRSSQSGHNSVRCTSFYCLRREAAVDTSTLEVRTANGFEKVFAALTK